MVRQFFAWSNVTALALLGALLVPEPASAQLFQRLRGRGGMGNSSYGGDYGGFDYSVPSYYSSPGYYTGSSFSPGYYTGSSFSPGYYTSPNFSTYGPTTSYQSFVPRRMGQYGFFGMNDVSGAFTTEQAAVINVAVPPNAEILFDGAQTSQNGPFRQFVSPPLIPGREYSYKIEIRWSEDGSTVTRSRRVTVHAGDVIHLAFNSETASASNIP